MEVQEILGNVGSMVHLFRPSIKDQVVEGVVDWVLLYCALGDAESGHREVDMLDILMKLYGEIFFAGEGLAEAVCEDHLFARLVPNGAVVFLQMRVACIEDRKACSVSFLWVYAFCTVLCLP